MPLQQLANFRSDRQGSGSPVFNSSSSSPDPTRLHHPYHAARHSPFPTSATTNYAPHPNLRPTPMPREHQYIPSQSSHNNRFPYYFTPQSRRDDNLNNSSGSVIIGGAGTVLPGTPSSPAPSTTPNPYSNVNKSSTAAAAVALSAAAAAASSSEEFHHLSPGVSLKSLSSQSFTLEQQQAQHHHEQLQQLHLLQQRHRMQEEHMKKQQQYLQARGIMIPSATAGGGVVPQPPPQPHQLPSAQEDSEEIMEYHNQQRKAVIEANSFLRQPHSQVLSSSGTTAATEEMMMMNYADAVASERRSVNHLHQQQHHHHHDLSSRYSIVPGEITATPCGNNSDSSGPPTPDRRNSSVDWEEGRNPMQSSIEKITQRGYVVKHEAMVGNSVNSPLADTDHTKAGVINRNPIYKKIEPDVNPASNDNQLDFSQVRSDDVRTNSPNYNNNDSENQFSNNQDNMYPNLPLETTFQEGQPFQDISLGNGDSTTTPVAGNTKSSNRSSNKYSNSNRSRSRTYTCSLCTFTCYKQIDLINHVSVHPDEKPFHCSQCDYKGAKYHYLRNHLLTHGDRKLLECTQCDYKSYMRGALNVHMKKHSDEKKFSCPDCSYRTHFKGNLKLHLRIHSGEKPYACTLCEFRCTQSGSLKIHMRGHSGEKPFSCTMCEYRTKHKGNLVMHMRKHTGDRPFHCEHCTYTTAQRMALVKHCSNVHGVVIPKSAIPYNAPQSSTNTTSNTRSFDEAIGAAIERTHTTASTKTTMTIKIRMKKTSSGEEGGQIAHIEEDSSSQPQCNNEALLKDIIEKVHTIQDSPKTVESKDDNTPVSRTSPIHSEQSEESGSEREESTQDQQENEEYEEQDRYPSVQDTLNEISSLSQGEQRSGELYSAVSTGRKYPKIDYTSSINKSENYVNIDYQGNNKGDNGNSVGNTEHSNDTGTAESFVNTEYAPNKCETYVNSEYSNSKTEAYINTDYCTNKKNRVDNSVEFRQGGDTCASTDYTTEGVRNSSTDPYDYIVNSNESKNEEGYSKHAFGDSNASGNNTGSKLGHSYLARNNNGKSSGKPACMAAYRTSSPSSSEHANDSLDDDCDDYQNKANDEADTYSPMYA